MFMQSHMHGLTIQEHSPYTVFGSYIYIYIYGRLNKHNAVSFVGDVIPYISSIL